MGFSFGGDTNELINLRVWDAIDKELGEITDVSLTHKEGYSVIYYKSNGEDKRIEIGGNNIRPMIQAFAYYFEALTHAPKKYEAFY